MMKHLVTLSMLSIALFMVTFGGAIQEQFVLSKDLLMHSLGAQVVGITVGVAPNELTELVQQVEEKQKELEMREIVVQEKEEAQIRQENIRFMSIEVYITILAFILLMLVLLNFYLDFRRERREPWVESGK